jgi:diguanylate cyclase (GGDEF)-like protein/PAS domain S-box-containing protein
MNRDFPLEPWQHLLNDFPAMVWCAGADGRHNWFNASWFAFTGHDPSQETSGMWEQSLHPDDREPCMARYREAFGKREPFSLEYRLRGADGAYRWVLDRGKPFFCGNGQFSGYFGLCDDIERYKATEHSMRLQAAAINATADMVVITNSAGIIEYVNPAFTAITGFTAEEAVGKTSRLLFSGQNNPAFYAQLWETLTMGKPWHGELINRCKDGNLYYDEQTITPVKDANGNIAHFVAIKRDITLRKQQEAQLNYLAQHDALTGLYNRNALLDSLRNAVGGAKRGRNAALLYIDLDQFKIVNDTLGHSSGDRLLVTLAGMLQRNVREQDLLARLGGDEFGLLLADVAPEQAMAIADKLRVEISEFRYSEGNQAFNIGASIGIAMIGGDAPPDDVLSQADIACYQAKSHGRNRVELYRPESPEKMRLHDDKEWLKRLRDALKHNRFQLHFQPVLRVRDSTVSHYEALIRLREENGELTPPGAFIPAAERFGLIREIDQWVITSAMKLVAARTLQGKMLHLTINLSGMTFHDEQTMRHIQQEIKGHGIDTDLLTFEITETAAISNLNEARRNIESLRNIGCHFALDDFGSGFSSFAYLRLLPVDFVKIDGMFIRNLFADPINQAMVRSMNDIAHAMGKQTIAEFVESEKVMDILREIGVDYAQGYHLGRPGEMANGG